MGRKSKTKMRQPPSAGLPDRNADVARESVDRSTPGPALRAQKHYLPLAICGFLILAVIVVFGQTAYFGFVNYDDYEYIYENPQVRRGLTCDGIVWAMTTFEVVN